MHVQEKTGVGEMKKIVADIYNYISVQILFYTERLYWNTIFLLDVIIIEICFITLPFPNSIDIYNLVRFIMLVHQ